MITKKWLDGKSDNIQDAIQVRKEVFIKEQKISEEDEIDGTDCLSKIFVLYEDFKPFATGRLIEKDNKIYIGRVAVLKTYRNKNYGTIVINELIKKAKSLGFNEVYLNSQLNSKEFYKKLNFEEYGEEFLEANIIHISMKKRV